MFLVSDMTPAVLSSCELRQQFNAWFGKNSQD
jgi:hypothetical protein